MKLTARNKAVAVRGCPFQVDTVAAQLGLMQDDMSDLAYRVEWFQQISGVSRYHAEIEVMEVRQMFMAEARARMH